MSEEKELIKTWPRSPQELVIDKQRFRIVFKDETEDRVTIRIEEKDERSDKS